MNELSHRGEDHETRPHGNDKVPRSAGLRFSPQTSNKAERDCTCIRCSMGRHAGEESERVEQSKGRRKLGPTARTSRSC